MNQEERWEHYLSSLTAKERRLFKAFLERRGSEAPQDIDRLRQAWEAELRRAAQ